MAHSPDLLETYLQGYAAFRNESGFSSEKQEVIFLVISRDHGCEYCTAPGNHFFSALLGVRVLARINPELACVTDAIGTALKSLGLAPMVLRDNH